MTTKANNTDFGDLCDYLGQINCIYVVYADNCEMYRSKVFSEALREFRKWVVQLNASMPNMGDKITLDVLL